VSGAKTLIHWCDSWEEAKETGDRLLALGKSFRVATETQLASDRYERVFPFWPFRYRRCLYRRKPTGGSRVRWRVEEQA
jgi:hypothetical protein